MEETSRAVAALIAIFAEPPWLNHDPLDEVPASLIGISVKVLFVGVITPSINAPMTIAGFTTEPIVIGWLIAPISSGVSLPVSGLRSIPAIA